MDREIPSVPITTLAGVASLTDLLPEMPLPTPLPQTLSNKSLLFHPRVAEEAQNLLSTREHALIPQLVHSLLQTNTDHIELKDHYASTEPNVDQQQTKPQLLQAILEKNPNVFNGAQVEVSRTPICWNHTGNNNDNSYMLSPTSATGSQYVHLSTSASANTAYGQLPSSSTSTPYSQLSSTSTTTTYGQHAGVGASTSTPYGQLSSSSSTSTPYGQLSAASSTGTPYGQLSPCGASRHTPQGSPASPASARLPLTSHHRPSVITEQQRPSCTQTPPRQSSHPSADPPSQHCLDPSPTTTPGGFGSSHQLPHQVPHQVPHQSTHPTNVSSRISQNCNSDQFVKVPPSIESHAQSGRSDLQNTNSKTALVTQVRYGASESVPGDGGVNSNTASSNTNTSTPSMHYPANMLNNIEDFEQALPVQRIQTVNVTTGNEMPQNSRVPSGAAITASTTSTSGMDPASSIIKAAQVSAPQTSSANNINSSVSASSANTNLPANTITTINNTIDNKNCFPSANTTCFTQTGANVNAALLQGGSTVSEVSNHVGQYSYLIGNETERRAVGCERQDHMAKPMNVRGTSPAQASDAPPAPSAPSTTSYLGEQSNTVSPVLQQPFNPPALPQPIVRLNRITQEDQALMQRSLSEFVENRPQLASELGITTTNQGAEESDGDDATYEPKTRSKANVKDRKRFGQEKEDVTDSFSTLVGTRKRSNRITQKEPEPTIEVPKPKLRRVERKFVPVLEKLSIEELMETNTYVRFSRSIDKLLENIDDAVLLEKRDAEMSSEEPLISRYQLQDLCSEAAKLKTLGAMQMIPADRLVRLLNILEDSIRGGERISPIADPDDNEDLRQMWMETAMERVMSAVDASLTCMYIMTSSGMSKRVYLEDVIDRVILFIKYQLHNTIFPSFDTVYRVDSKKKVDNRKKRNQGTQVREKGIVQLYNKTHELVSLLAELLGLQTLTDTTVLHASSMGVSPFFVDNVSELQLSCLKLVTTIFTRYENHRRLLLDDILASIARLPSSKRGLRSYRLLSDTEEYIQMLTALILQLIQCVVALPENLANGKDKDKHREKEQVVDTPNKMNVDRDVLINSKYEVASKTAVTFLTVFLSKCGNKCEEIDYRPLFENFVQDLLTTVNKPEWPATEMLLSFLGMMLVKNFSNKTVDVTLRVASLDYLGVIAARLRKDAVTSRCKLQTIDQMIKDIKAEENKEGDEESSSKSKFTDPEEERGHFLQRVLLDYLAVNGQKDQAHRYARHFYLVLWYRDAIVEKKSIASGKSPHSNKDKLNNKPKKGVASDDDSGDDSEIDESYERLQASSSDQLNELYRNIDERKKFYITKIRPFQDSLSSGNRVQVLQTYIDYKSAELISQYLASKRQFSQSFDKYLAQILLVLRETSIAIRTKAMKCLTMIVEADPSVLGRTDMQLGVNHSFLDHSTSVREAAVDLVGKFVLSRPELIDKYYNMLLARILDTGVSVRKRVIKILKDICIECPQFHKIPEICVKMIRRVNDEEGIRKLVMEVFQNMWFTPTSERNMCDIDCDLLLRKVMNIIDVVASSKDIGIEWFEMLLISLFKPREDKDDSTKIVSEPPKSLLTACRQIVDCLIENVLRLEESAGGPGGGGNERLVACLITLYLFAKIRPQLLVKHASTLQPYLSYKCQTKIDHQIVSYVAQTLELVVPLIVHPSETFLAQLEEDAIKLILQSERPVVASCIACLSSIVNNVTRNYKLIRDCFNKYYGNLCFYKTVVDKESLHPNLERCKPIFRRSMFTVGLLLRHFDFTDKDVITDLPCDIKDQVFNLLTYYLGLDDTNIQANTLKAIGSICVRHYDFMLVENLKQFYHKMLINQNAPLEMKTEVLKNIEMYLLEEENRMIKQDQEWSKRSKEENLKEMGDVSSGMASTVIQLYLKEILESFIHPNILVRHAAMRVIQLVLQQGLVHPVTIVPYLICMSTDDEKMVSNSADKQLQDIEKKYPGFIHMKSQLGIRLSFQLQRILQPDEIVRGYRIKERGEYPGALNGFLYSILRNTKQQRRAIVLSILKQFDEQGRTSLSYMLYLADNLAYFPYQVQDEPLFIIHHIDIMISVSGTNLLQAFREGLLPLNGPGLPVAPQIIPPPAEMNMDTSLETTTPILVQVPVLNTSILDDDDEEDEADLLARLPEDTRPLLSCITAAQGCLLLLVLKQHLKDIFGISDSKILQYSPTEMAKIYEKAITRRSNSVFNPKATLNKLRQGAPPTVLDEQGRKDLIGQYLDFKQLMLKLDPDDEEDEDAAKAASGTLNNVGSSPNQPGQTQTADVASRLPTCTSVIANDITPYVLPMPTNVGQPSNICKETSPPRVPKLVISNRRPIGNLETPDSRSRSSRSNRNSEKTKKHRQKRRRKKISTSSGDDSENDYSDPDFLV